MAFPIKIYSAMYLCKKLLESKKQIFGKVEKHK